jgi:cytochrome c peroxidase
MKKLRWGFYLIGMLLVCTQFLSFTTHPAESALAAVTQQFHQGLAEVQTKIAHYKTAAENLKETEKSVETLQQAHLATRLAFKKIEFLLEYNDRSQVRRFLNGPPLPFVDESAPWVNVMEPKGLQVLDELAFAENPVETKAELLAHLREFEQHFKETATYQRHIQLQHRFVLESARYELIRVFTLGVTGFDTPGSGNAMPEALTALNAVYQAISAYLPLLEQSQPKLAAQIRKTFGETLVYLQKNHDFDTFDRLTFLKTYVNPLFSLTYQMHRALQIELQEDVTNVPQALNYHADNLFSNDLLDVGYYLNNDPNSITDQRIALGRTLFFDPILSSNNQRACASCHNPDRAFTDGLARSFAFDHQGYIQRNAPTLINSVYSERYFYDLREPQLERQIRHVVNDSLEFNTDFFEIADKIKQSTEYRRLFAVAYPGYDISLWPIADALACYVSTLTGFNSPFDQYVRGETQRIDPAVARGFNLFMGKAACGSCHFAPTFNGTVPPYYQETESEVLGVPFTKDTVKARLDPDLGRFASGRPYDITPFYEHSFKTTTVRNAALTAPYMHNGVYDTLEEVVEFYNKGGGQGLGLELPYQTLPFDNLSLNKQEVKDIVQFMEALTDTTGLTQRPAKLPIFETKPEWNKRKIGGDY